MKMRQYGQDDEITGLVQRSGILFIYAATVCSDVGEAHREGVKTRLQEFLSNTFQGTSSPEDTPYAVLDNLYHGILDAAYKKNSRDIANVLHIIVAARHPLSL